MIILPRAYICIYMADNYIGVKTIIIIIERDEDIIAIAIIIIASEKSLFIFKAYFIPLSQQ